MSTNYEFLDVNLIPTIQDFRVREENGDFCIIVNLKQRFWLISSRSFVEILLLCDGKRSLNDIIKIYSEEFPDTDLNIIAKDVREVIVNSLNLGFLFIK